MEIICTMFKKLLRMAKDQLDVKGEGRQARTGVKLPNPWRHEDNY
jgi:hypothetical protein